MDHGQLVNILIFLGAAVVSVPIFRKLGFGSVLGYLVAGILIGPQGFAVLYDAESALHIGEIGVVMLLFVIGLELNPETLWKMKGTMAIFGLGQILGSAILISLAALLLFDFSLNVQIIIGLTLALSSTAFAVQLMEERHLTGTDLGRKGFSILLSQDIAVIPILLLTGVLAGVSASGESGGEDTPPFWVGILVIVGLLTIGKLFLCKFLSFVARHGSKEILTAYCLLAVLGIGLLLQDTGLSMGLGAFVAGIILANTSFRHQLEADIEPFKNLLLGLFFIAVGMSLDLSLFLKSPLVILGLALLLMTLKVGVIVSIARFRKHDWTQSFLLGLLLCQGGEFAFVINAEALQVGLMEEAIANQINLIVGISMALTAPLLMLFQRYADRLAEKRKQEQSENMDDRLDEADTPEVIIAGFGRFGQMVGRILKANNIAFNPIDLDASHIEFMEKFGVKVFFGDASNPELLESAGIANAKTLVIAIDDEKAANKIAELVRAEHPNVYIIARAKNRMHMYELINLGITNVIRETFESGLLAARETLKSIGYNDRQSIRKVKRFRDHDLRMVYESSEHNEDFETLIELAREGRKELSAIFDSDRETERG